MTTATKNLGEELRKAANDLWQQAIWLDNTIARHDDMGQDMQLELGEVRSDLMKVVESLSGQAAKLEGK